MTRPREIRRTALIAAVERAIERNRADGYRVRAADLRRVRAAARSMTRCLVGGWWNGELKCGCVVAEAFPEFRKRPGRPPAHLLLLYGVGVQIDYEISGGYYEISGGYRRRRAPYLRVRDR